MNVERRGTALRRRGETRTRRLVVWRRRWWTVARWWTLARWRTLVGRPLVVAGSRVGDRRRRSRPALSVVRGLLLGLFAVALAAIRSVVEVAPIEGEPIALEQLSRDILDRPNGAARSYDHHLARGNINGRGRPPPRPPPAHHRDRGGSIAHQQRVLGALDRCGRRRRFGLEAALGVGELCHPLIG